MSSCCSDSAASDWFTQPEAWGFEHCVMVRWTYIFPLRLLGSFYISEIYGFRWRTSTYLSLSFKTCTEKKNMVQFQTQSGLFLVLFHSVMYTTSNRPSLTKWPHAAQVNIPTSWWHNVIICRGFCSLFLRRQVRRLLLEPDDFKGITTHAESPEGNDWTVN